MYVIQCLVLTLDSRSNLWEILRYNLQRNKTASFNVDSLISYALHYVLYVEQKEGHQHYHHGHGCGKYPGEEEGSEEEWQLEVSSQSKAQGLARDSRRKSPT